MASQHGTIPPLTPVAQSAVRDDVAAREAEKAAREAEKAEKAAAAEAAEAAGSAGADAPRSGSASERGDR